MISQTSSYICARKNWKLPLFLGLNVYVQYVHVLVYIKKPLFLYMHVQFIKTNFQCPWMKYVMIKTSPTTKITYIFKKWQLLDTCSYFKNKKNIVEKLFYFYFFSRRTNFSILFLFFFPPPHQIIWKIFRKSKNKKMLALVDDSDISRSKIYCGLLLVLRSTKYFV